MALVGTMHRDLVQGRRWISESDYKDGLALAQLMPGPLAAQLAIYLGFVDYRLPGATAAGVAFVLPSFAMVVALGWAYRRYGGLDWMQAVFFGVGAAVIGIIAIHGYRLTRRTIREPLSWAIYVASAAATIVRETEYVLLFLGAGALVWIARRKKKNTLPTRAVAGFALPLGMFAELPWSAAMQTRLDIALFFTKAGDFVFGSGLAIVPFLYSGVVHEYHWLDQDQFLDAVAVAMITPGPVVITVAFIGYIVDGFTGATLAAVAVFLPCYFFTVLPAPYFKKYGTRPGVAAFVDGVTAAAIGAIAGSVVVLARRTLFDDQAGGLGPKLVIMLTTAAVLASTKRIPEPLIVLAAAIAGLAVYPYVRP